MEMLAATLQRAARFGLIAGLCAAGCGAVQAADLPLRPALPPAEPVVLPPPPPDWSGFAIGFDAGYARTGTQHLKTSGLTPQEQALIDFGNLSTVAMPGSSYVLRGGLGYDVQLAPYSGLVVGVVADALYTNLQRTRSAGFSFAGSDVALTANQTLDFLGTVRTDIARQAIFVRRDRLFDLAADGKIDFDSIEYQSVRSGLESMIRYAHILTWPHYVVSAIYSVKSNIGTSNRLSMLDATNLIEDIEVRNEVYKIINETTVHLIIMMALKSILLAPVALLFVLTAFCRSLALKTIGHLRFIESVTASIARNAMISDRGMKA